MKNFRNFSNREISFLAGKNIIIGNNGKGKSNILEALSLPIGGMVESDGKYLLQKGSDVMYLKYQLSMGVMAYAYDGIHQKKKYFLGEKSTTPAKIRYNYPHIITFHPMMMNLMYLGPSHRREFLDGILTASIPEYRKTLSNYKKVLHNRNKLLKNISLGKSETGELQFWNQKYIALAGDIYKYRLKIINFFTQHESSFKHYFFGKVKQTRFVYETKIDLQDIQNSLQQYISKNQEKEILLRKTMRGPHLDDFDVLVDDISLIHFASRGEVKSVLLGLKFLETQFIEQYSEKKDIIFIIDDLLSELDTIHRELLWDHVGNRQCIMSSIEDIEITGNKIYI